MDNLELFKECLNNDEIIWDDFYTSIIFTKSDFKNIDNYFEIAKNIKEKIITIKQLKEKWQNENIDIFVEDILNLLLTKNWWWKYNEFACFLHTCDITIDWIKKIKSIWIQEAKKVIKDITLEYIKHRSIYDIVVKEWIVALYDDWASRKQWKTWELKIKTILIKKGYTFTENWNDFLNWDKTLAFISSNKWIFSAENIRIKLWIVYQFNKDKKKSSDVLVKNWDNLYILEAKHLKEWWWNQDKQFQEIVDIIWYSETKISYIWFLDWIYWNFLLKNNSEYKDTNKTRIEVITERLVQNKNNYFINTYWLEKLF